MSFCAIHKDELAVKKRAYYQAHKDELAVKQRAYYQAHKDERAALGISSGIVPLGLAMDLAVELGPFDYSVQKK